MDSHSDNRTRSWLFRLKYLKVFKNSNSSNNTSEENRICAARNTANEAFTQSTTTRNNLNDSTDLRRSETHLGKSIKKWHNRMKNCFWKNNRHLTARPPICIAHEAHSPSFSRVSNGGHF